MEKTLKTREIYQCERPEAFLSNEKITAVDAYDNTVVLVDGNGFIQTFEMVCVDPKNKPYELRPLGGTRQKRYKSDCIKYLPRAHMIAILDDNRLQIMTRDLGAQP